MKLEDLTINASVKGVLADSLVTVVSVKWFHIVGQSFDYMVM